MENFSDAVKEQYLATQLEDNLDKSKILEYYLNTINLGQNATGVQAAAKWYFDKEIMDINLSEAAALAAMAADPVAFSPLTKQEKNAERRRTVLKNMLEEEYISEDEYEEALGDDVYLRIQNVNATKADVSETTNSYYTDAVLEEVIEDLKENLGYSQTEAYNLLYRGGLRIYTCQESSLQKICDTVINSKQYYPTEENGESDEQPQASFVLLEQSTGKVKAIVGGRDKKATNREINRATGLKRSPGTVFAMLSTYAPALDTAGITLGNVQDDTAYQDKSLGNMIQQMGDKDYAGLLTLRKAITNSKNLPAVKVLQDISVQTGYDFLKKFAITTIVEKKSNEDGNVYSDLQPQLALGELNEGVTNLELTAAYAAIANGGVYQKPRFYTKIEDKNGKVILENKISSKRIIKDDTAWLLTNAMKDVIKKGSGKSAGFKNVETSVAGNNGNTVQNTDYWFEGYTPYYTAGIWSGADDGTAQKQSDYYMVIWKEIMEKVHEKTKKTQGTFEKPQDIVTRRICSKCGNLAVEGLCDEAEGGSTIYKEYFSLGTEPEKNCTCHVRYEFCKESNRLANEACPTEDIYYRVLLQKSETTETADTPNTVAYNTLDGKCNVHK